MRTKDNSSTLHKVLTVIGWVLCILLIPILIVNCTLLVKSFVNKDAVPDFAGTLPLIVLTDSMYPDIQSGDLIICQTIDAEDVEVGDVISFYDPASSSSAVVTHMVIEIIDENGMLSFRTKGINNNTEDRISVPEGKLVGKYTGTRFAYAGNIALFMQTVPGLIVCVVVPIVLLVGYDMLRRRMYEKNKGNDMAALMAELEALKKMQNAECRTQNADEMQNAECRTQNEDEMQNAECRTQNEDDQKQSD